MNKGTESSWDETTLTAERLTAAIKEMSHLTKFPPLPPGRKKGRFEKFMNRRGWYRQTEMYVIESNKLFGLGGVYGIGGGMTPINWKE